MNNVLVICKGTGQAKSFERVMDEYTKKNNLPIEWIYTDDKAYLDIIAEKEVKIVVITPEVILSEAKIKAELEGKNIPYMVLKPADFGLKRTEKYMPEIEKYID
ncbi:hypothetical protein ACQPU1_13195 [Clostridium paraputrificum]|uniref:hypothetical protein n=1 Tax=Clostridium TaxID=1485 RepID=UPI003D351BDB